MEHFFATLEHGETNPNPKVSYYPTENNQTGAALVIFAGGGYAHRAPHEGEEYALFFQKNGITCFVVEYRIAPERHPAMLEDGFAAIETIRKRSDEFGVDPNKIGVIGSSAGGHLVSTLITLFDSYSSSVSLRPDFAVLCYPVISSQSFPHKGSFDNLLGESATDEQRKELSSELNVSKNTPPCFIWHTWEDDIVPVENSLLFAQSLRKKGVRFDLHIFERGRHGLGFYSDFNWGERLLQWIMSHVT